jgi:hypothetical protein
VAPRTWHILALGISSSTVIGFDIGTFPPPFMATTAAASVPTAFLIMMDAFAWLTKLISSLNLLVTYPIYISLLFFLHRRRFTAPFNSSFYRLFWLLGIVDLTKYSLYLLKKCSYWGWVSSNF